MEKNYAEECGKSFKREKECVLTFLSFVLKTASKIVYFFLNWHVIWGHYPALRSGSRKWQIKQFFMKIFFCTGTVFSVCGGTCFLEWIFQIEAVYLRKGIFKHHVYMLTTPTYWARKYWLQYRNWQKIISWALP